MSRATIHTKTFQELTTTDLYEIQKARFKVFVVEQRCFYLDLDDIDYESIHVFMTEGQKEVAAYGRLFREDQPGVWHIGRVLTVHRGAGLGRQLMASIIRTASELGATTLRMEAQVHAIGFYEKLGFAVCSDEFEEAGIPHVRMERTLLST